MNKEEINVDGRTKQDLLFEVSSLGSKLSDEIVKNENLQQENQELKKQLEYLRSGEYLNQLRFERDMLQDLVDKKEISKVDKEFIDMTHRNTELLEQQQEFIEYLENKIKHYKEHFEFVCKYSSLPSDDTRIILEKDDLIIQKLDKILSKYIEIIGGKE